MEDVSIVQAHHMHHSNDLKVEHILLWHRPLGHLSFGYLQHVFPNLFSGLSNLDIKCETCILVKSHRVTYPLSMNKSDIPFALIHYDVWGPSPKSTMFGFRVFVIFIDDCTRMTWIYLLKHKKEVFHVFKSFHTMIQTQFAAKLQTL
jgi:hypothetical protein